MSGTAFNSQIYVGVADVNILRTERIKLILPANGTWTANFSNTAQNALMWADGAMIYGGTGSGEGQPFIITTASGTTLRAVCGNDPTIGGTPPHPYASYFHAEGFSCNVGNGSTVQDAIIEVSNGEDESYVGHVTATATAGATLTRGLWVHGSCCSSTYEDINVDVGNLANALPCVFGNYTGSTDQNQGIHASKLSCVHPGNSTVAVLILQTGGNGSTGSGIGNTFRDIFMEQLPGGTQDTTVPWVSVRQYGDAFPAADVLDGLRPYDDITNSTRCVVDIGSNTRVNISNLTLSNTSTCAIRDDANASTVTGAVNSVIASYDMTPRFRLALGATTVSSLPPAATNAGTMFRVSDSTAISAEGQACAGGSSNNALAFSNGVGWKCF
jgi:hypothetical protein